MSKTLQSKYYAPKIKGLRASNPRNWWHNVKMITGQKTSASQPRRGLANLHNAGNMKELATSTNVFFQQIAADLCPLDDDVMPAFPDHIPAEFTIEQAEVERKLSEINIYKASGRDGLPNWLLRDFSAQLAGLVCAIYNASVREGFIPLHSHSQLASLVRCGQLRCHLWQCSHSAYC